MYYNLIRLMLNLRNFLVEFAPRGFPDQPVKLEPRDHVASPYLAYAGNYRDPSQTTPSPQPISPPMFAQASTSPSTYNNLGTILQNQLQAPRATPMANNFQQQTIANQIYTPNIQTTTAQQFANGNSIWTNNLNGNEPSSSRPFFTNNMPIFNQPLTPLPNITQNFNISNEPMLNSSILIDLDNQILNNLSGDLQSLSFSDFAMDSYSKTGEKAAGNAQNK